MMMIRFCEAFALRPSVSSPLPLRTSLGMAGRVGRSDANDNNNDKPNDKRDKTNDEEKVGFLLRDFVLYNGELCDPYATLKVSRRATDGEIKAAYRRLSRRYHPDMVRQQQRLRQQQSAAGYILPGSCNDLDEVRQEWERIAWSHALLVDPARRRKYDRHEAWADPAKAMRRAAAQAAWDGLASVGRGLWKAGRGAVSTVWQVQQQQQQQQKQQQSREHPTSPSGVDQRVPPVGERMGETTTTTNPAGTTTTTTHGEATVLEYKSRSPFDFAVTGLMDVVPKPLPAVPASLSEGKKEAVQNVSS